MSKLMHKEFENFIVGPNCSMFSVILIILKIFTALNLADEYLKNPLEDIPLQMRIFVLTLLMTLFMLTIIVTTTERLNRKLIVVPVPRGNLFQYC